MSTTPSIDVRHLRKVYGEIVAVDDLTFTVARGAVLGLLAGGDTTSESVLRGVEYLVKHQREDGGWDERLATGTGFPRVFYLTYHLYRQSFPTLALAEFMKLKNGSKEGLG